jgi:hypothetical protein
VMMLEMENEATIFHHETATHAGHGVDSAKGSEV